MDYVCQVGCCHESSIASSNLKMYSLKKHCQTEGILYNFNDDLAFQVKSITSKWFFIAGLPLFTKIGKADIKGL